jgi:hypothetical protein
MHRRPNAEGNGDDATGQDGVGSTIPWFSAPRESPVRLGVAIWIEHGCRASEHATVLITVVQEYRKDQVGPEI